MKTLCLTLTYCLLLLPIAGCSDSHKAVTVEARAAPAAHPVDQSSKAVMSSDEMVKHHCGGSFEKIGPLVDACGVEKDAGRALTGPNCIALSEGSAKVAEIRKKSPGACSPKVRF